MKMSRTQQNRLDDIKVNVKLQLAALWISLMFLYIYIDYFHLYMPGKMEAIQNGRVFEFDINQVFIFAALISLMIPALMIFLSVVVPAHVNRWTNIITAAVYIPYTLYNLVGEPWIHMIIGTIAEVALLCLIICYAWKWPRKEN